MRETGSQTPAWLRLAQIVWVIAVAGILLMGVAGSVLYYERLRQVCLAEAMVCGQLDLATPAGVDQLAARGLSLESYALLLVAYRLLTSLIPTVLGILIFYRRRSEPIALLVSFFLISWGQSNGSLNVLAGSYPLFDIPAQMLELAGAVMLALFLGLFPNGRMVPRAYWVVVVYFALGYLVQSTLGLIDINSGLGTFWSWSGWLATLLGGVAAQIYRYLRVSTPIERKKTRWVLFGMALMIIGLMSAVLYTVVVSDFTIGGPADLDLPRRIAFLAVTNLAFVILFLSIGMAILRSQLFDIDVIIRKSLQYGVLSLLLALVYLGSVVVLQGLFGAAVGESPILIVLSTLLIAALFRPLRRRVQAFIDRRFFRQKYDALQILAQFAQTAQDEVSLDALMAELTIVVQETMQPEMVSLWLKR